MESHLLRWAFKDPDNTWALAHGLHALGSKIKLNDGTLVVDQILSHANVRSLGGRTFPVFEGDSSDGTPREPHRNLVLRALLGAGLSLDREFRAGDRDWKILDLVEGMFWFFVPPTSNLGWGREAWTLMSMADAVRAGYGSENFKNHQGLEFDISSLAEMASKELSNKMDFLDKLRDNGHDLVKRRQGVYSEPCGGFHFVEGPSMWLPTRNKSSDLATSLSKVQDLLGFRLRIESELYERIRKGATPQVVLLLAIQDLKFFGHWLEATAALRDNGLMGATSADVARAKLGLVEAVERLSGYRAFDLMDDIRANRKQSYLDLIGDAAHALGGLRAWADKPKTGSK